MTPGRHAARAARIERSLRKCSNRDYEAVIEAAMLAGTHWFNVALHRMGLTPDSEDVMHAEYMTQALRLKLSLSARSILDALDAIEAFRPGYVRGDVSGGIAAAARCRRLLATIRVAARGAKPPRP